MNETSKKKTGNKTKIKTYIRLKLNSGFKSIHAGCARMTITAAKDGLTTDEVTASCKEICKTFNHSIILPETKSEIAIAFSTTNKTIADLCESMKANVRVRNASVDRIFYIDYKDQ